MLQTFQDRKDLIRFVLLDQASDVKVLEGFGLLFKWYRYETALRKANKYQLLAEKLAKPLGEEVEILLFRRNLNESDTED